MICHDEILFWILEHRCTGDLRSVHWPVPIVLLTLVTYNMKLYLPWILIQSPCLFTYTLGQVYNSALTLWRASRLHVRLDRCVGDSIKVFNILESCFFSILYDFFKPSELCKIFYNFPGGSMPPDLPRRSPPFQILVTSLPPVLQMEQSAHSSQESTRACQANFWE